MNTPNYNIIDWDDSYEASSMELEKSNLQGKSVQLEIVKQDFLGRARAFEDYYCCLAVADNQVVGSAIAAKTFLKLNNEERYTGFGFDAKVDPSWRNRGIGKKLALRLYEKYFSHHSLQGSFMTAKLQNAAVHKMVKGAIQKTHIYPFVYLTIPVYASIKKTGIIGPQNFSVSLLRKESTTPRSYTDFETGLGCFYTNQFYSVRVNKISFLYKSSISLLKIIQPSRYKYLPGEGANLFFATLYNHNIENIGQLNEVLHHLQIKGIQYLQVCCQEKDAIYNYLKKYAVNSYPYCIRADFEINESDKIALDVRCL